MESGETPRIRQIYNRVLVVGRKNKTIATEKEAWGDGWEERRRGMARLDRKERGREKKRRDIRPRRGRDRRSTTKGTVTARRLRNAPIRAYARVARRRPRVGTAGISLLRGLVRSFTTRPSFRLVGCVTGGGDGGGGGGDDDDDASARRPQPLSLIHISEPTRPY